ncbi:MAG TPA: DUF2807 domain-containing protein [Aliidongia sp.]|nr:DUF2807 domain-containing protein [Aliidongia sp.]
MTRFLILGTTAIIALLALSDLARAESTSQTVEGEQLDIRTSCVKSVTIEPQAGLAGKVLVQATAASAEELAPLSFAGGETALIERKGNCGGFNEPTLVIDIKVPAGMPLDIHNGGSGDYVIGSVGGPLKAEFAGSGDLHGGDFTALQLAISGSSDVELGKLDGPVSIDIHGSGDARIGTAMAPDLKIAIAGSGNVEIEGGEIGNLDVAIAGSGDVRLNATAKEAALRTAGSGDIEVAHVTGNITQHSTGSGSIRING